MILLGIAYICTMFIINTTYHAPVADARELVIWLAEVYIPQAEASGLLSDGRLNRILSHKEEDSECFALQLSAQSTADIHKWLAHRGRELNEELLRMFDQRVLGFSTLMETVNS